MAVERKEINGKIFIAQTTYYVFESEEHLQEDHAYLRTSNKNVFDGHVQLEIKRKNNPENLTQEEIKNKITNLEKGIHLSIMLLGTDKYCQNRIERVKKLKTYLI